MIFKSLIKTLVTKIGLQRLVTKLTFSSQKYWEKRAKDHGVLSVLNLSHSEDDIQKITEFQINTLFPLLKRELNGSEKYLLDYGCGPGRFTGSLAALIDGYATGIDPIPHLLELAPKHETVTFKTMHDQNIPASNESFDIIWICLVIGGILNKKALNKSIKEIFRVAKKGSLLFLVENTTQKDDILTWKYRSKETYLQLFNEFNIKHVQDYQDLGETISIFAGRKEHYE